MQKLAADTIVHSHAPRHVVNVAAYRIAKVGDLIDKRDFCSEKCIGSVLGKFRRLKRGDHYWGLNEKQRSIQFLHYIDSSLFIAPDHDAIRTHKILDRRTFA